MFCVSLLPLPLPVGRRLTPAGWVHAFLLRGLCLADTRQHTTRDYHPHDTAHGPIHLPEHLPSFGSLPPRRRHTATNVTWFFYRFCAYYWFSLYFAASYRFGAHTTPHARTRYPGYAFPPIHLLIVRHLHCVYRRLRIAPACRRAGFGGAMVIELWVTRTRARFLHLPAHGYPVRKTA